MMRVWWHKLKGHDVFDVTTLALGNGGWQTGCRTCGKWLA